MDRQKKVGKPNGLEGLSHKSLLVLSGGMFSFEYNALSEQAFVQYVGCEHASIYSNLSNVAYLKDCA